MTFLSNYLEVSKLVCIFAVSNAFDYPVNILRNAEGSKPEPTLLHLKATFGWLLFFIPFLKQPIERRMIQNELVNGNPFSSLENQDFYT